jgi:hypothetical protein
MKRKFELLIFTVPVLLVFSVSCGINDEEIAADNDVQKNVSDDFGEMNDDGLSEESDAVFNDSDAITADGDDEAKDDSVPDDEVSDYTLEDDAQCKEIIADFHSGDRYVVFNSFSSLTEKPLCYDLSITKYDGGPAYFLGANSSDGTIVAAINMGNSVNFEDVVTAPESGYQTDDSDNMNFVIGSGWRVQGGTGSVGFEMTKNIYVIKTCDQKHAKIIFTQGKAGILKMDVCYQPNGSLGIAGFVQ